MLYIYHQDETSVYSKGMLLERLWQLEGEPTGSIFRKIGQLDTPRGDAQTRRGKTADKWVCLKLDCQTSDLPPL